jgi:hypothetical protein
LFGAKECFPAGEVLVVGVEGMLVVEGGCESKYVVFGHALTKGLQECGAIRLREGLTGEEVLRDLASLVQSVVGTESCAAKGLLIGLWIDLLERVVSEDRVASTVASKIEYHLGFAIGLCLPDEIAHSILKPLNTICRVVRWDAQDCNILNMLALCISEIESTDLPHIQPRLSSSLQQQGWD